jgi:hypothetical protein
MSVSVYNPARKLWQQTWVDDQGSYIALEGGYKDGNMILQTLRNPAAPKQVSRMVFKDIKKDSFLWNWEGSKDGGKTWTLNWQITYTRKS